MDNIKINYETQISKHDMVWNRMPENWCEAPFLGNGIDGIFVCREDNGKKLKFEVGNTRVFDNRSDDPEKFISDRERLPIGNFTVKTKGEIVSLNMRLSLYKALLTGEIKTSAGEIEFLAYVHKERPIIVCSMTCKSGEDSEWEWNPEEAMNPRHTYGVVHNQDFRKVPGLTPHDKPVISTHGDINICTQHLLGKTQYATAWKVVKTEQTKTLYISTSYTKTSPRACDIAKEIIENINHNDFDKMFCEHKDSWAQYYKKSFLSFPDKKLEDFYWIQIYKLNSAINKNGGIVDNQGPWLYDTPWGGLWWNLNVQLSNYPLYPSNRFELAQSVINTLVNNTQALINNVSEEYRYDSAGIGSASADDLNACVAEPGRGKKGLVELGNLTWMLHDCYLHHRVTMDDDILKKCVYPLLRRSVNLYIHYLYEDENKVLHLKATQSPEYGVLDEDTNYELALLRWGIKTLIYCCERLNIKDELQPKWEYIQEHLTDYPINQDGYMIAKNTPYEMSHRHFSHLMMGYPLYLIDFDNKEDRELIEKSFLYWQSKPEYLCGFSITAGTSFHASLGQGDKALELLRTLYGTIQPNTMYKECGPVIETPLSGAQAIHEMMLQSWGGKIRIFPAIPSEWKDVMFLNMRAEGAFFVSAKLTDGKISYIKIESLAGEPCTVKCEGIKNLLNKNQVKIDYIDDETAVIHIKKGESAVLWDDKRIEMVENTDTNHYFGLV